MLDVLRKKGVNKTILWIIAIIIILSFGVFGTAYLFSNPAESAGTMYGRSVSRNDFAQAYQDTRSQYIMAYGDEYLKMEGKIDLEPAAWDRLILLKEAKKRDIQASDQEVVAYIYMLPFFQRGGQFDQDLYSAIAQNVFGRSTHEFEEFIRRQLIMKKLLDAVAPPLALNDDELKKEYQKRNEKITLEYVLFSASDYAKKASTNDDEIKTYYEGHKEEFRLPPSIVVNYVQVKDKAAADALLQKLTPDADFAAVAKTFSLEVKTSTSFTQDQPFSAFASDPSDIANFFKMDIGEYSPVLKTPDGWQIVQLKEKNDPVIPALQDIKDKVKQAVLLEKGFTLAKKQADASLTAITAALKTKDFKTAATDTGLNVQETPAFGRQENMTAPGLVQEFQQEADGLNTDNRLSEVISTSQGPAIIYLEKTQKPDDKQFDLDKEHFRQMLATDQRNQTLINFMTELRIKADIKSKLKQQ